MADMTSRNSSQRAGLAAFSVHPTPIGQALVVVTGEGLAALQLLDVRLGAREDVLAALQLLDVRLGAREDVLAALTDDLGLRLTPDDAATAPVTSQLDAYFAGELRAFDVALVLRGVHGFTRAALDAVCEIPYGAVASYADVAVAARRPGANRAVGTACARTPISIILPAHRVVRSDGSIGEYGGHPERKRFLLDLEEEVLRRAGGHEGSASV